MIPLQADQSDVDAMVRSLQPGRGRLLLSVPMAPMTWFRVGGAALAVYRPADIDDLQSFIASCPLPVLPMGMCSNVIIRDGGLQSVVIRLTGADFTFIQVDGATMVVGGGALDRTVAETAGVHGLGGLEFLAGIPGTMGAAVRMNAGCYGRTMADVVDHVVVLMPSGALQKLTKSECGFGYRSSIIPQDAIVIQVVLQGIPSDPKDVAQAMQTLLSQREATQPVRARTGGSTFKNPDGAKAWELIDQAGCRGLRKGGAQVSEVHCNFLINNGNANAHDLESLGEEVRQRVFNCHGVVLEWEVDRLGVFANDDVAQPRFTSPAKAPKSKLASVKPTGSSTKKDKNVLTSTGD